MGTCRPQNELKGILDVAKKIADKISSHAKRLNKHTMPFECCSLTIGRLARENPQTCTNKKKATDRTPYISVQRSKKVMNKNHQKENIGNPDTLPFFAHIV